MFGLPKFFFMHTQMYANELVGVCSLLPLFSGGSMMKHGTHRSIGWMGSSYVLSIRTLIVS